MLIYTNNDDDDNNKNYNYNENFFVVRILCCWINKNKE